ncbi:MAG: hypothetical protein OFPII_39880 [Osedax symbiont Rs1]|nr:MAG: hypothetical protein OFPII_39880 [Osedax symbiont Rs1]
MIKKFILPPMINSNKQLARLKKVTTLSASRFFSSQLTEFQRLLAIEKLLFFK